MTESDLTNLVDAALKECFHAAGEGVKAAAKAAGKDWELTWDVFQSSITVGIDKDHGEPNDPSPIVKKAFEKQLSGPSGKAVWKLNGPVVLANATATGACAVAIAIEAKQSEITKEVFKGAIKAIRKICKIMPAAETSPQESRTPRERAYYCDY